MNKEAKAELQRLYKDSPTRTLRPERVVEFAKNPDTHLHKYFTWDDGEAAQAYRLLQARSLIRVAVVVLEETSEKVRAFVSLSPDRKAGNGYRATVDVLDDEKMTAQLVEDAKAELNAFARKYHRLKDVAELRGVFEAIDQATTRRNQEAVAA